MRFRLNRVTIAGLILGGVAAILLAVEWTLRIDLDLNYLLGLDGKPGNVRVVWVVAIVALVTYTVGRGIDVWENHRRQFRRPPRP